MALLTDLRHGAGSDVAHGPDRLLADVLLRVVHQARQSRDHAQVKRGLGISNVSAVGS